MKTNKRFARFANALKAGASAMKEALLFSQEPPSFNKGVLEVKDLGWLAALTVGFLSLAPAAWGQAPASGGTRVAVIDVSYLIKNSNYFKGQIDSIKGQIDAYKAKLAAEQKAFMQEREKLKQWEPTSQQFKQLEEELTRKQVEARLASAREQKKFLEQEAQVYFNTYTQIENSVKAIATRNGIGVVLRFNGEKMDPKKRDSIMQGVTRYVVYHDPRLDITPLILNQINPPAIGVRPGPRPNPNPTVR